MANAVTQKKEKALGIGVHRKFIKRTTTGRFREYQQRSPQVEEEEESTGAVDT